MAQPITIDPTEAEDGLFCEKCGDRFNGNENAYLVSDNTPTGQHVVCCFCTEA